MMPIRIGLGLLTVGVADGKKIEEEEEESTPYLTALSTIIVMVAALVGFLLGYISSRSQVPRTINPATTEIEDRVPHAPLQEVDVSTETGRDAAEQERDVKENFDLRLRMVLMDFTHAELQAMCLREGFAPGRPTKECMTLALMRQMSDKSKQDIVRAFRDLRRRTCREPSTKR